MLKIKNKFRIIIVLLLFISICNAVPITADMDTNPILTPFKTLDDKMLFTLSQKRNEYKEQLLATHPVIVGLFSVEGGQFILYRPYKQPESLKLPQAINYRIAGIVEHTTMVAYELGVSYVNINNQVKRQNILTQMSEYQIQVRNTLANIDPLPVSSAEKLLYKNLLNNAANFINTCINTKQITGSGLNTYYNEIAPNLAKLSEIATTYQVKYWSSVILEWKNTLGSQWQNTYGAIEYIYVNPKNNILLQLLAKYMPANSLNNTLFLFNTTSYAPTAEDALKLLVIKEPDHALSQKVFGTFFGQAASVLPKTAINVLHQQ